MKITEYTIQIRSRLLINTYRKWIKKNSRVLDAGCGNGVLSEILKRELNIKVTCCDIENYLKKDLPFVLMDNKSKLPFADNSFDVVMFNDCLHHTSYDNQKKLLKEAFRISNKVVLFEDEQNFIETIIDWGINKFHNRNMPIILTFRKPVQWMALFDSLKLKYKYEKVKKPLLYPLIHEAFCLYK